MNNITYSFNEKHDKPQLGQLQMSYHSKQKATRMKIGLESKLHKKQKQSLKYNTIDMGKDKTVKSVCIFEQLSRNKNCNQLLRSVCK